MNDTSVAPPDYPVALPAKPPGYLLWRRGIVVALMLLVAGLIITPRALPPFGYHLIAIEGGSMSPTYVAGDVLIARAPTGEDLRAGVVVTVGDPGSLYTHRVMNVDASGAAQLQGDANATADPRRVTEADVYAVPQARITGASAAAIILLSSSFGTIMLVIIATAATAVLWPRQPLWRRHVDSSVSSET